MRWNTLIRDGIEHPKLSIQNSARHTDITQMCITDIKILNLWL